MNIRNKYELKKYEDVILLANNKMNEYETLLVTKSYYKLNNYKMAKEYIDKYIHEHKYYYEYLIIKVEIYMYEKKYIDAAIIIKEELNMPYLDKKYALFFEKTLEKIVSEKLKDKFNANDIEDLINSDEDNQILAISLLKSQNIRNYLELVEKVLNNQQYQLKLKNLIIELLFEQEINEKFELRFEGYYDIINIYQYVNERNETYEKIINECLTDNISYNNAIKEVTTVIILNTYPQILSISEYTKTISALVKQMFNQDVEEKNINMDLLDYFKELVY